MVRLAFVLLALLAARPAQAHAQLDAPAAPHDVLATADREDWVLRVTRLDGEVVTGRVRELDVSEVRLEGGRVLLSTITLVERGERTGGGGRAGALTGAVAGGVLFAALLFTVPGEGMSDGAVLAVPLIGGLLGAVIGGLAGSAIVPSETEWQTVWPVE